MLNNAFLSVFVWGWGSPGWDGAVYEPDHKHGSKYRQFIARYSCKNKKCHTPFDPDVGQKDWWNHGDAEIVGRDQPHHLSYIHIGLEGLEHDPQLYGKYQVSYGAQWEGDGQVTEVDYFSGKQEVYSP